MRPWLMEHRILLGQEGEASITLRYDEDVDCLIEEKSLKLRPVTG